MHARTFARMQSFTHALTHTARNPIKAASTLFLVFVKYCFDHSFEGSSCPYFNNNVWVALGGWHYAFVAMRGLPWGIDATLS
jgi:hypothetical protein